MKVSVRCVFDRSLRDLARCNGFLEDCEHWGDRHLAQGLLGDIYDGRVWKEFQNVSGQPFLADPNDLDWFNPFKHTEYSVGMYLVVLNLPRSKHLTTS